MLILSVDWDYFFPNTFEFDWGHRESSFFLEAIWALRAGTRGLRSNERAIDKMRPDKTLVEYFWAQFTSQFPPRQLVVAESHTSLYQYMEDRNIVGATVWNFDAHHDLGYGLSQFNCGNWAREAARNCWMDEYHLVYPAWRKNEPEAEIPTVKGLKFDVHYEIPKLTGRPLVFICRSGSWTPTWSDAAWLRFVRFFRRYSVTWNLMAFNPFAMKRRSPNMTEAKRLAKQHDDMLQKCMEKTNDRQLCRHA